MPTYEYVCRSCDTHLEVVQKFNEQSLSECPACGGVLRKVFGAIGISFKGSGFYKTDSRSSPKAKVGASSKGEGSGSDGGKESGGKDSGAGKESGSKEPGSGKESGSKESGGDKASTGKDGSSRGSRDSNASAGSGTASSSSSSAKTA